MIIFLRLLFFPPDKFEFKLKKIIPYDKFQFALGLDQNLKVKVKDMYIFFGTREKK